ncbi:UNVERIFIED_CONTAM: hypothetical protein GTU68_047531, partial [Idotea baltica]|nr:hypothetical protein [Idotea baltica]
MIRRLSDYSVKQNIRSDGPQTHLLKAGTPTMGGAFLLLSILVSTLLWGDLENRYIWMVCFVTFAFGAIGAFDDIKKLIQGGSAGISARLKYALQSAVALIAAWWMFQTAVMPVETNLYVPLFKNIVIDLGVWFIVLTYFVIVGSSNAVNLTDGLDGLAIMPTAMVAEYLAIPFIPLAGELVVFCAAIVGAGLGFLWFNAYPAQVFMGDVGALSLGAALGVVAVLVRQEIVLVIMGGVFVVETLS